MQLPHFEGSRIANIGRGAGRIAGIGLAAGSVALVGGVIGYNVHKGGSAKAYGDSIEESTAIACAAPTVRKTTMQDNIRTYYLEAHLVTKASTNEKPQFVTVLDTDGKLVLPQEQVSELQKDDAVRLMQPEIIPQIPLTAQRIGNAATVSIVFTTTAGNIVRCAPLNLDTDPPTPSPTPSPSLTPSSEITIK